jgi:hypothetical protein
MVPPHFSTTLSFFDVKAHEPSLCFWSGIGTVVVVVDGVPPLDETVTVALHKYVPQGGQPPPPPAVPDGESPEAGAGSSDEGGASPLAGGDSYEEGPGWAHGESTPPGEPGPPVHAIAPARAPPRPSTNRRPPMTRA